MIWCARCLLLKQLMDWLVGWVRWRGLVGLGDEMPPLVVGNDIDIADADVRVLDYGREQVVKLSGEPLDIVLAQHRRVVLPIEQHTAVLREAVDFRLEAIEVGMLFDERNFQTVSKTWLGQLNELKRERKERRLDLLASFRSEEHTPELQSH